MCSRDNATAEMEAARRCGGDAHDDDVTSRLLRAAPMRLNTEHGICTFKKLRESRVYGNPLTQVGYTRDRLVSTHLSHRKPTLHADLLNNL